MGDRVELQRSLPLYQDVVNEGG